MLKTLKHLLKDEARTLAPYAMHSAKSLGRLHAYPKDRPDNTRTPFQRDRDRILHSKSFRRLQAKTQVFVSYYGDHYRDRLTHTIEVSQIARDVARSLALNEDLAEAIALAHDLGHPPFGHGGEFVLDELMRAHGRHFEHNEQSRRILEKLETMSPNFDGLNLTIEVLDGLLKHEQSHNLAHIKFVTSAHLESQVVDMADEIAYTNHDIDDGLRSGLITVAMLRKFKIWCRAEKDIKKLYPQKMGAADSAPAKAMQSRVISRMISLMIHDLCTTSEKNIKKARLHSVADVRKHKGKIIDFSSALKPELRRLGEFLKRNFYYNPKVNDQIVRGQKILKKLFRYYIKTPQQLPEIFRNEIHLGEAPEVVVKDYIAGMTDHFAEEQAKLIKN